MYICTIVQGVLIFTTKVEYETAATEQTWRLLHAYTCTRTYQVRALCMNKTAELCQDEPESGRLPHLDHELHRGIVDLSTRTHSSRHTLLPMQFLQASFVGVSEDLAKAASSEIHKITT